MRARYVCTYVPRNIARYALAISTYTIIYGDMVDVHAHVMHAYDMYIRT